MKRAIGSPRESLVETTVQKRVLNEKKLPRPSTIRKIRTNEGLFIYMNECNYANAYTGDGEGERREGGKKSGRI